MLDERRKVYKIYPREWERMGRNDARCVEGPAETNITDLYTSQFAYCPGPVFLDRCLEAELRGCTRPGWSTITEEQWGTK